MSIPSKHVFVCANCRPIGGRPACGNRGGKELVDALAVGVAARAELRGTTRVTSCDCLGPCFDGPNLVVYPEGIWYGGVAAADVEEILDVHLVGGQPVSRLLLDSDDDAS